jgi:hypothetical protein
MSNHDQDEFVDRSRPRLRSGNLPEARPSALHHLDALLDSMLSQYSAVEPRPGLELRIHAHLKIHAARRRWRLALVFGVSTAIIVAAVYIRRPAQREPVRQTTQRVNTPQVQPAVSVARIGHASPQAPVRNSASDRTQALLQLAEATHANNGLALDEDPPSVAAEAAEPAASEASPSTTRSISIQNLSVDSLEIKDLAPTRDDEGGNL